MFDIQLEINQCLLKLGMTTSTCDKYLSDKKTSKTSFITRMLIHCHKSERAYFNKNCEITCFNGKFVVIPNLDINTGADEMYATSGFVYFKDNRINKLVFQILDSRKYAPYFFTKFESICENIYGIGTPVEIHGTQVKLWDNHGSRLTAEYKPAKGYACFTLTRKS